MIMIPQLQYEKDALDPYISKETIEYHYWKHHMAYVDNLNKLIAWWEFDWMELENIIKNSNGPIYNNAAQVWNHNFYWKCLIPNWWWDPTWKIKEKIDEIFEDFYNFKEVFSKAALTNFGSGWTWLAITPEWKLEIISTSNADNLLKTEKKALLVIDIWEHAYYIDYRNARVKYIDSFWNLINWDFVNSNL